MKGIEICELKVGNLEGNALPKVAALAAEIWMEHFTPIIGQAQVRYMLDQFQTAGKILNDLRTGGFRYFTASSGEELVGYFAVKPGPGKDGLQLSKLYVHRKSRGLGIASQFYQMIRNIAGECGYTQIWLLVNKRNTSSIDIYKKWGFIIAEEVAADIGSGFVMDDYRMVLELDTILEASSQKC